MCINLAYGLGPKSLTELENMVPWEREIYVDLLVNHIKEEKEKARERSKNG